MTCARRLRSAALARGRAVAPLLLDARPAGVVLPLDARPPGVLGDLGGVVAAVLGLLRLLGPPPGVQAGHIAAVASGQQSGRRHSGSGAGVARRLRPMACARRLRSAALARGRAVAPLLLDARPAGVVLPLDARPPGVLGDLGGVVAAVLGLLRLLG